MKNGRIDIPVEIVAGQSDMIVPLEPNVRAIAQLVPNATLHLLPGGHYIFLAVCTDNGVKRQPLLCADPVNVKRDDVHERAAALAARFFSRTLR